MNLYRMSEQTAVSFPKDHGWLWQTGRQAVWGAVIPSAEGPLDIVGRSETKGFPVVAEP